METPKPPGCSAETAARLYYRLEYYREYMPAVLGCSPERYAITQEAKSTDAALKAYRDETGAEDTYANSMFKKG